VSYLVLLALIAGLWWWNGKQAASRRRGDSMTEAEARRLLDLPAHADLSAVRAAHQRLILRVHPDAGGSEGLAARVNSARDILVQKLEQRRPR